MATADESSERTQNGARHRENHCRAEVHRYDEFHNGKHDTQDPNVTTTMAAINLITVPVTCNQAERLAASAWPFAVAGEHCNN